MWIAAFSNLSTSFNLVNISLAHVILENQFCKGSCETAVAAASTACLAGAVFGQLTFGYVGDCLGRGKAMRLTMLLSILGAFTSAFAVPISSEDASVFSFLLFTRLILGIGVGGVYPLAATLSAESSSEGKRGRSVALVFSMQGIGNVLVPVVGLVLFKIFGTPDEPAIGAMPGMSWRVLLGIGALPGLLLAPFKTTPSAAPSVQPSAAPVAAAQVSLWQALRSPRYLRKLLGTAGGWFILDVTFFGNLLFAPVVLKQVFKNADDTPLDGSTVKDNLCYQMLILALIGLPGYYVSVLFMDKLGRKLIQLQGFFFMAVLYGILAIWLDELNSGLLIVIYGLTYFFSNFGPNCTTFILPSETFPQEVRSTLNGFSAACGKAGAVVGSAAFGPIATSYGNGAAMAACAVCAVVGFFLTLFFVEDRRGKGMAGNSIMVAKEPLTEDASTVDASTADA
jgi:PHS family inorganic phosphate transporter-like MFS transporter